MAARRVPLTFAITVLIFGCIGAIVSRTLIELFLFAELISVASFYVFFSVIIPAVFPKEVKPEAIFTGGAARAPYLRGDELFAPGVPFLIEEEESEEG